MSVCVCMRMMCVCVCWCYNWAHFGRLYLTWWREQVSRKGRSCGRRGAQARPLVRGAERPGLRHCLDWRGRTKSRDRRSAKERETANSLCRADGRTHVCTPRPRNSDWTKFEWTRARLAAKLPTIAVRGALKTKFELYYTFDIQLFRFI